MRGIRWVFPLAALAAVGLAIGCAQFDSSVGTSVVGGQFEGTLRDTLIPVDRTADQVVGDIYKRSNVSMIVGQQDGMKSEMLLRYRNLTALGDTVLAVKSASVTLFTSGLVDSAKAQDTTAWSAVVYRIEDTYDPLTVKFSDDLALTPIDTIPLGTFNSEDSITFDVDTSEVRSWLEQDTLNYGLLIRPMFEQAGFLKQFFARPSRADQIPALSVLADIKTGDTVFPDSLANISPDFATYLADDTTYAHDGLLVMSQGYVRRMLFHGDFSGFSSQNVSVNRVDLVLHADNEWPHNLKSAGPFTWMDATSDWSESSDSVTYGTDATLDYSVPDDTNRVRLNVTPAVRYWVVYPDSNYGLAVHPRSEWSTTSRWAFYDITAADSAMRPYFHVVYTEYDTP